jgi:protein TonB
MQKRDILIRNILYSLFLFLVFNISAKIKGKELLPNDDDFAIVVDKMPAPVGGIETLVKKIVYPSMAISTRTEGKVYLMIYIDESGNVIDVKIVKGIGAGCDEESMRVVKKIKFTPGLQNGIPVKVKFSLALSFKLP